MVETRSVPSEAQAELDKIKGRIYSVRVRRGSNKENVTSLMIYFGTLTLWLGISHAWFGGSWVIDLVALLAALAVPISLKKRVGDHVTMSPEEMRDWLDAGCPDTWGLPTHG